MLLTFEERLPEIEKIVDSRKSKWYLSTIAWEDVRQILLIRIFNKYHLYDGEKGEFIRWANRLITNAIRSLLRDNLYKYSRPCIQGRGCVYNLGEEFCSYTKSGKQCAECPLFAKWKNKKGNQYNVKQSLPLQNHIQEVNNIQHDFIEIDSAKVIIDEKMKETLKPYEYSIYKLIYIENKSEQEAGKILDYKKCNNSDIPGYQIIRKVKKRIVERAREIINEEGLV